MRDAAEAQTRELALVAERTVEAQRDKQRALDEGRRAAQQEPAAVLRVEEVDRRVRSLHARLALEEQVREVTRTLRAAERQSVAARGRLAAARADRDGARAHERAALAAALARARRHGEACPVCGGAEHPSPARRWLRKAAATKRPATPIDGTTRRSRRSGAPRPTRPSSRASSTRSRASWNEQRDADGATASRARRGPARGGAGAERRASVERAADDAERSLASLARSLQRVAGARAQAERGAAEAAATIAQLEPRVEAARARLAAEGVDGATLAALARTRRARTRGSPRRGGRGDSRGARGGRGAPGPHGSRGRARSRERDEAGRTVDAGERRFAEALAAHGVAWAEADADGGTAHRAGAGRAARRGGVAGLARAGDGRGGGARGRRARGRRGGARGRGRGSTRGADKARSARWARSSSAGQLAAVASRAAAWAGDGDERGRWKTARAVSNAVNGRHEEKQGSRAMYCSSNSTAWQPARARAST